VLWLQEHLATAIPTQEVTGVFTAATQTNLEAFQTAHGVPATGQTDPTTWADLLALAPVAVQWTANGPAS
jgi:peptidoglycan hydrolase-like protein with peptidoglycan-binding domain